MALSLFLKIHLPSFLISPFCWEVLNTLMCRLIAQQHPEKLKWDSKTNLSISSHSIIFCKKLIAWWEVTRDSQTDLKLRPDTQPRWHYLPEKKYKKNKIKALFISIISRYRVAPNKHKCMFPYNSILFLQFVICFLNKEIVNVHHHLPLSRVSLSDLCKSQAFHM